MTLPGTGSVATNLFFSPSNREDGVCRLSRRSSWWISRRSNLHGRTLPGRAFLHWQPVVALPEEMSKRFRRGEEGRKYSFPGTGKEGEPLLFARLGPGLSLEGRGGGAHSASRNEGRLPSRKYAAACLGGSTTGLSPDCRIYFRRAA